MTKEDSKSNSKRGHGSNALILGFFGNAHVDNEAEETSHDNLTKESFARGESRGHSIGTERTLTGVRDHAVKERGTEDRTDNLSADVGDALNEVAVSRKEERKSDSGVQVAARDVANRVGKNHDGHTEGKGGVDTETGVDNNSISQDSSLLTEDSVGIVGSAIIGITSVSTGTERTEADGGAATDEDKEHHT